MTAVFMSDAYGQSASELPKLSAMHQLYVQDQRDRGVPLSESGERLKLSGEEKPFPSLDPETQIAHDAARREQARALLASGTITSAQDFHYAAFIFQHGQDARDYLLAHILAIEAVVRGDASAKWISAASLDRYLQAIGQPQVFGTQYSDRDYAFVVQHKKDPAAIKAHKHELGMSQEPYDADLMPDAIRLTFCVPDRVQQELNLKVFESGAYPSSIIPEGCRR
jgi:hypothetical protein